MARTRRGVGPGAVIESPGHASGGPAGARSALAVAFPPVGMALPDPQPAACLAEAGAGGGVENLHGLLRFASGDTPELGSGALSSGDFRQAKETRASCICWLGTQDSFSRPAGCRSAAADASKRDIVAGKSQLHPRCVMSPFTVGSGGATPQSNQRCTCNHLVMSTPPLTTAPGH
jgi:hypothetical protein